MNREVVGRGELKLKEAAEAFGCDFRGKVVLDIGSSTGGFTEYALRRGAKRVIAIEKGTGQMKAPLRYDSRVELYEKVDFFEVNKEGNGAEKRGRNEGELVSAEQVGESSEGIEIDLSKVEMVVADVSFVSLRKILARAKKILPEKAEYIVMLKPQFEAYPDQLARGVVKNEKMRREIMRMFEEWLKREGFVILKKRDNETKGKVGGNVERFYWLRVSVK